MRAASSMAWIQYTLMSVLLVSDMMLYGSYINVPPGLTRGSNLSSDGWLSTMAVSYLHRIGEAIRWSLMMTVTLAVPPRCSGPYEGIQDTSFPSMSPAYAIILPIESTPCPPNPLMIISSFISSVVSCDSSVYFCFVETVFLRSPSG